MPRSPDGASGSRRGRVIFLSVSAGVTALVLALSHEVLFPFVLAIVLAYVLTPLVRRVERARLPRWAAVLVVYAFVLLGGWASVAATAPRLVAEMQSLIADAPSLALKARDEYVPAARAWLVRRTGIHLDQVSAEPPPAAAPGEPDAHLSRRADGSWDIDVGAGVDVRQVGDGHWRIEPISPRAAARPFDLANLGTEAASRALAYGQKNVVELLRLGRDVVAAVSRAIFIFFMTFMLAAYLMITRERVYDFFRSLVRPPSRRSFDALVARVDQGLAGVVRGQLLICLVNGVLSAVGFSLFGLKYWPILAVLAGVMSLVPIFGSIFSSIPIVAVALTQSLHTAVLVLAWIVGIHQLEANFLNPKIIGDAAKIHPVLVVFSLLVGEHFFAVPGALLAVPVMSIAQSLFLHLRLVAFGDEAPPDSFVPPAPPS